MSRFGPEGLNRRRAERVAMTMPMPPVSVVGARLVDASCYGMLIESPMAFEREAVVQLRLVVSGESGDIEARVVRCAPLEREGRGFVVGLEFTRISDALRARLGRTLAELPGPDVKPRPRRRRPSPSRPGSPS